MILFPDSSMLIRSNSKNIRARWLLCQYRRVCMRDTIEKQNSTHFHWRIVDIQQINGSSMSTFLKTAENLSTPNTISSSRASGIKQVNTESGERTALFEFDAHSFPCQNSSHLVRCISFAQRLEIIPIRRTDHEHFRFGQAILYIFGHNFHSPSVRSWAFSSDLHRAMRSVCVRRGRCEVRCEL